MNASLIDVSKVSERRDIASLSEGHALIAAIERAARDPNVDVTKMERLFAMRKEVAAEIAETAFNNAMNACQAEMTPIATDAVNPQTRSKYATYGKLDGKLRPIYTRHGFSISFNEGKSEHADHVLVLAYVSNAGHTRIYQADMPADGKGAKGGDVMTKTHAVGAAKSYGKRYLLKDIFNIAIGEEDKDGNDVETVTPEQVQKLEKLIKEGGGDLAKALRFMKVASLADIPAKNYDSVVKDIEAVNRAKARAKEGGK